MIESQKFSFKVNRLNLRGIGEVLDQNSRPILEIPFSLPDETVCFSNDHSGEPKQLKFYVKSPDRAQPLCAHYQQCGGCSLQHASKTFVTNWKESVLAHVLSQKGLYPDFRSTYVTPERSRRRAVFSGRRTKKD